MNGENGKKRPLAGRGRPVNGSHSNHQLNGAHPKVKKRRKDHSSANESEKPSAAEASQGRGVAEKALFPNDHRKPSAAAAASLQDDRKPAAAAAATASLKSAPSEDRKPPPAASLKSGKPSASKNHGFRHALLLGSDVKTSKKTKKPPKPPPPPHRALPHRSSSHHGSASSAGDDRKPPPAAAAAQAHRNKSRPRQGRLHDDGYYLQDPVLSATEMEALWLQEECLFCLTKNAPVEDRSLFVYQYASDALRVRLRHGDDRRQTEEEKLAKVFRNDWLVQRRIPLVRLHLRGCIQRGVRRKCMARVIGELRLKGRNGAQRSFPERDEMTYHAAEVETNYTTHLAQLQKRPSVASRQASSSSQPVVRRYTSVEAVDPETMQVAHTFESLKEAGEKAGVDPRRIGNIVNGKTPETETLKGFLWRRKTDATQVAASASHNEPSNDPSSGVAAAAERRPSMPSPQSAFIRQSSGLRVPIQQLDPDTMSVIDTFASLSQAERDAGVDRKLLSDIVNGNKPATTLLKGCLWRRQPDASEGAASASQDRPSTDQYGPVNQASTAACPGATSKAAAPSLQSSAIQKASSSSLKSAASTESWKQDMAEMETETESDAEFAG